MNKPPERKVMDTLEFLYLNQEARRKEEERQKYLHDQASLIEWAMENGYEKNLTEGLAKGERKKALEISKKLLALGVEIDVIVQASGLSEAEVESLKSIQ